MENILKNKNILVGVTGSVAVYKTLELIRLFIKSGAKVRVLMSEESKRFITPLMFEAISQNQVMHTETESWANDNNHIHIGKWSDIFVVAPMSANSINKIAHGISDNLLVQTLLAYEKQIFIAPAANTHMILHPSTQESLKKLKSYGYKIIEPQDKLLACNDKGIGAMAEPQEIYWRICAHLLKDDFWKGKEVLITGGGTKEKIDQVRYISNFSSGKMAKALATWAYLLGAHVTYIGTDETSDLPHEITTYHAPSSQELQKAIQKNLKNGSFLFMVAAVSDYVCEHVHEGKLKKETLGEKTTLSLVKNIDILQSLDKKNITTIGFKAELDASNALKNAQRMLKEKHLDAVCLNVLGTHNNFGSEKNAITLITKSQETQIAFNTKSHVAFEIFRELKTI
ncbi:bifunctional phosphopantothenoylcysteine decarboxylase/phosphopantothenate--cysteine ligase CoaBC [Sulfurospirillum sp. 1612]|uniref:bifunctional phosphopantothenoylcysteine decarboxylase/phosphopantothenate--cysteine ligase CoaBC n=1 Tax=Sulfurospirillum sp. 1612 TaxID=3094835 RepID=UPI002F9356A7